MTYQRLVTWVGICVFAFAACFFINNDNVSSQNLDLSENTKKDLETQDLRAMTLSIASSLASDFGRGQPIDELAEKRFIMLADLIEKDAAEVLRVALPAELLQKIPAGLEDKFEKRIETEGELEVVAECEDADGHVRYYLKTGEERLSLYFAKQPEEELLTGAKVKVKGVRVGDAIAADNMEAKDFQVTDSVLPNTFGEQRVLVLLVNFQDNQTQPYTVAQANNLLFNASNSSSVTNYYREASYGQASVTGNTVGWFTLPMNADCNARSQIATYAKQAATNSGINLSDYNKFMYVYPRQSACVNTGIGEIGGTQTWINGSLILRTTAHELGHNLGLYHSRAKDCGSVVVGGSCTTIEYGHVADMIGASGITGHFHSFQKERLGWLNYGSSPTVTTVSTSGNYYIAGYSAQDSNAKGLKILKSTDSLGKKTWYYVEFRRPIGFDSFISGNSSLMNGVLITMDAESNGAENYLLDMTPETSSFSDSALAVNRSYTDSSIGLTITPLSVDSNGTMVSVNFGIVPCNLANPTLVVSPSATQWLGAGSSVNYTVTVTNNNSSNCADNNFDLQTNLPSGWSSTFNSSSLYVAPGMSVSTSLQVVSPSFATDGFYPVGISANNALNSNYSASASVNCAVYSSLGVSVSTNQQSYTSTQTAIVSSVVSANGSPMSGANVTFTITGPNGSVVSGSATTATNGSASFSYKFNRKKDPLGTYQVSVNASLNGISGSGSTSFQLIR